MKYDTTKEKCAENLRLALAQMNKHLAGLHPITFSVWYEYVSGGNQSLNRDLDVLIKDGSKLTDEATRTLYDKHVAEMNEVTAQRIQAELHKILNQVSKSAEVTGQSASKYENGLGNLQVELAGTQSNAALSKYVDVAIKETNEIKGALNEFGESLTVTRTELDQLRDELAKVKAEVLIDGLTNLTNRRGFDKQIDELMRTSEETGAIFSLVIIDIDHFKKLNDNYGHVFGDRVLRALGQIMKNGVKGRDMVARYGGEEFAVLLPETGLMGAQILADQIRSHIERARIRKMSTEETIDAITISAGVAEYKIGEDVSEFVQRADKALYAAKGAGRNQVMVG
jgi:diguanylate cyclase